MPVKLNDFTPTSIADNSDIKFDYVDLDGVDDILEAGEECDYEFVVYWDLNSTNQAPSDVTFEIQLDYQQYTTAPEVEKLHTHDAVPSGGGDEPTVTTGWTQNGTTVTNGDVTLEVGQAVTGYEANGVSNWYVLGAEDGNMLITTNVNVENISLLGRSGYINGIAILNSESLKYSDGNLAKSVRSIDADDINRVTGYSPVGTNVGNLNEYGNQIDLFWEGTSSPYVSSSNGVTGYLSECDNGFYYPTENDWIISEISSAATIDSREKITTLTSTYYAYNGKTILGEDNLASILLFNNTGHYPGGAGSYWLGTQEVMFTNTAPVGYRLHIVAIGGIYDASLANSYGTEFNSNCGLRPVVELKSSVNVTSEGALSNN